MLLEGLFEKVSEKAGITKKDAELITRSVIDVIRDSLAEGEEIKIKGLGKFYTVDKSETMAKNPVTQEPVVVPAKRVPKFSFAESLKDSIK